MKLVRWSLPLLLVACGPKGGGGDPKKVVDDPPVVEAPEDPVPVNDPEVVCGEGVVFQFELTYPEGCPMILSEEGGEIDELEIESVGKASGPSIIEPVDLMADGFTFAPAGCGARIHFTSDSGTFDVTFAAVGGGDTEVAGTGVWTPGAGGGCEVALSGKYTDWAVDEESGQ